MGRGRQKAKDAKIARQLKYTSHNTDLQSLERELLSSTTSEDSDDQDESYTDRWSDEN